jgi:long-chain acyl-CoA synthetase
MSKSERPAKLSKTGDKKLLEGLPQRTDGQLREDFETIVHAFKYAVETKPDTIALTCGEEQATYKEYGEGAARVAAFLKSQGIQRGDRVVICVDPSIFLPMMIYGGLAAGAQITMVNQLFTEREITPLLKITEPKLILCGATSKEALQKCASDNQIVLIDTDGPSESWQDTSATTLPNDLPSANDGAVIMFTGGTTGISKGVPHSHAKVIAANEIMENRWSTDLGTDVLLNVPPLFHITGLYHGVFQTVFGCNGLIILPRFHPELVFDAITNHQVSVLIAGVPTAYNAMLGHPDFDKVDFSRVKFCGTGGAALADKIKVEWESRTGVPALEGYGMTEGAPTCNNPLVGQRKSYSAGLPVACTEFRITDLEDGISEMPTGERGEICVRGPHIAESYYNNEEATKASFKEGWLHTGDVAYLDEDGFVFIVDRVKDMAIVSGFNVFPREIDEVLVAHPKVLEAAAIGVPDDYRGEVIKVFVALRNDETLSEKELLNYCSENLVKYKMPSIVEFTKNLPKTPVGKIDKKQLKA